MFSFNISKLLYSFLFLFIITILITTNYINKVSTLDYLFFKEQQLFNDDMKIYINFSTVKTIHKLKRIRRLSRYKKKGYGGHPPKYLFSFPLDNNIQITPTVKYKSIELLIFIHCRTDEFYERYISRKSYNNKSRKYAIIYITSKSKIIDIDKKLKEEASIYNDILQFNELSSYFNLSIQTLHMILWSIKIDFKFLLKTDIDVFININLINNLMKNFRSNNSAFALGRVSNTYVLRNRKYSHYIPYEIIKESMYPPYLQGVGYFIPYKTMLLICTNIQAINPKIWIEDVYMGYVFKYHNISLIDLSAYIIRDIPYNVSSVINNINKYILVHGLYPFEIYLLNHITKLYKYG